MTKDIQKWLDQFKKNWKQKKVDKVLKLFSENVDYHETPTQKLEDKEEIREEWQNIKNQKDIKLDLEVWSRGGDMYTVKWHLEYTENNSRKVLNGVYLIKLNKQNICKEFWHYCQAK